MEEVQLIVLVIILNMKTRTRGYIKELKEISLEERICIMFLCFSLMLGWSILVAQSLISSPNYPITFESYHHKTTQAKVFELLNEQLTVREADKMMAIAWCESTMNQYALHSNKDGSTDRGVFQISNKFQN